MQDAAISFQSVLWLNDTSYSKSVWRSG